MSTTALSGTRADARMDRYRAAERMLWDHYGLTPMERFVEVGSPAVRLRVVEVGAGAPILFTHGTIGNGPAWAALVTQLTNFRCLMIDRPGFGLSSPIKFSAATYGATVADLQRDVLDALAVERVDLVGGSIGNVWALRLAQRHSPRVRRVVLLGGGPIVQEIGVPRTIAMLASPIGAVMLQAIKRSGPVTGMIRGSGHVASLERGRIPAQLIEWRTAGNRYTDSMRNERAMIRTIVSRDGWRRGLTFTDGELTDITQPTLMVFGTADPTGNPAVWKRVMDLIPRGRLRLIDGAGHMPWFDEPATVAAEMQRFLAAEDDRAGA